MRKMLVILLALLLISAGFSCATTRERVRRHTYPVSFRYIEPQDLRSSMWQLAYYVDLLDRAMRDPDPVDEARRAEIAALLRAMEQAADSLAPDAEATNHPMIREHLDEFRRNLALARAGVEYDPPSYFLAGFVSGACLTCHAPE